MAAATMDNVFGPQTNVYRIANKMFALVNTDGTGMATLKTLPDEGDALQAKYPSITGGHYMNKRHWLTVDLAGDVPAAELCELVTESYRLVFESLPKKRRAEIHANNV